MAWVSEVKVLKDRTGKHLLPYPRVVAYSNADPKLERFELLLAISEAENLLSNLQAAVDEARSV